MKDRATADAMPTGQEAAPPVPDARTITLARHGQSLANAGGVTMPHADIPLTDEGHEQARRLAGLLPDQPGCWHRRFCVRGKRPSPIANARE